MSIEEEVLTVVRLCSEVERRLGLYERRFGWEICMREKRGKFVGGSWLGAFLLWAADCVCEWCVVCGVCTCALPPPLLLLLLLLLPHSSLKHHLKRHLGATLCEAGKLLVSGGKQKQSPLSLELRGTAGSRAIGRAPL